MRTYQPSDKTRQYLTSWLGKSRKYQEGKGRIFNLTVEDFMDLWGDRRLQKLDQWVQGGMRDNRMHKDNAFAMVLTWKDRDVAKHAVMDRNTAAVKARFKSKEELGMRAGDKHSPKARELSGAVHKGKKQSADHIEKRAAAQRGIKRGPRSPEVIAKIKATKAANKARKANDGVEE